MLNNVVGYWAYIWGTYTRSGGLIFWGAYIRGGLYSGGGAYIQGGLIFGMR